jgi:hypothetical protein
MAELIGNLLDIFGVTHKKSKKEVSAYMKRYYKAIDDYRKAYSEVIARKLKTPTEIKKLGLYDAEAFDQGVSAMGGKGMPNLGIPGMGEIPILIPTNTTTYVPSLARVEQLEAKIAQLRAIIDGTANKEDRKKFLRQLRKQIDQLQRQRLAIKLTIARREEPGKAKDYFVKSVAELTRLLNEAIPNEEKEPLDEEKIPYEENMAQSSEDLETVENLMRTTERAYPGTPNYQGISYHNIKTGKKIKATRGNAVHWSVLRDVIIKSLTENYTAAENILMINQRDLTTRTESIGFVLSTLVELPDSLQRILDLFASYNIDLRDINPRAGAEEARSNVRILLDRIRQLSPEERNNFRYSFTKLIRVLIEQRLETKLKATDKTRLSDILDRIYKGIPDLPEKPINVNDFINIEHEELLTTLQKLFADAGETFGQIRAINNELSSYGIEQTVAEYEQLIQERSEGKNDMSNDEARIEASAITYNKMILQMLTYIQNLRNTIESRFIKNDHLRNFENMLKLKRTLTQLKSEIQKGIATAVMKLASARSYSNIANTLRDINNTITDIGNVIDSLKNATTPSGVPIDRDAYERFDQNPDNIIQDEYDDPDVKWDNEGIPHPPPLNLPDPERMFNVQPENRNWARQRLRELSGRGRDLVEIGWRGLSVGIGSIATEINWAGVSVARLRRILIAHVENKPSIGNHEREFTLREIANSPVDRLYIIAETLFKNNDDRANLLLENPDLRPRRNPDDPPEPPSGSIVFGINGVYRTIKVASVVALLVLLGFATAKIIKIIKDAQNGKSGSTSTTIPPTETKDPTNIGTGGDSPNNNIPPDNIPPNIPSNLPDSDSSQSNTMFPISTGNTDPIYGGIGNITTRSQPFKPIGYPTLDEKLGADYIEPDENMLRNSAIMELVQSYNDDATRYNELIALKYDLEKSEQSLTPDELKELTDLSTGMKNQIININQQAPLVPSLGYTEGRYYAPADSIKPTKTTGAFVSSSGESISNVYPLIPIDDYTKSIGLNDDIQSYNALAKEYNALALKYKGARMDPYWVDIIKQKSEEPEYAKALARATAIDTQIQPIIAKINSVMSNPESSVGREYGRTLGYNDLQKSLIDKVANITDWNLISSITEQEKQSLRDNPELYKDFESLLTTFNMKTNNGKDALSLDRDNPKWSEFYRVKQRFIDLKKANYKMPNEKAPLAQTDWKLVQNDSQKEYVRSKQDFLDAVARLKNAKASGLSSHQVSQLYNDLESKRLHYETSRQTYEKMADSYKHSLSGRTSFLADMTQERLPDTPDQMEKFDRLQTIERILQNNPDALKEYNDGVVALGINVKLSTEQTYDLRTKFIEGLAKKYNLVNEYKDASTRLIDVKIPNMAEDPNTIVDFQGEGSDEVGESTERANFIDPSEATLFMSDQRERALEQKRWEDFSLVQPWNGLGNPQTNPLLRHQVQEYITRYGKTDKAPKPTPQQLRQLDQYRDQIIKNREQQPNYKTDFPFMPTVQASFGREIWENEFAIPTNNFRSQQAIFTREDNDLSDNQFNTWYPKTGNIYHPDRQIDSNNFDPSATAKLRTNSNRRPVFEGLPSGFNQQYGSQQVSQLGGETMNNNFGSNPKRVEGQPINPPQRRPNSVFDNLDMSARRTMSMRR